MPATSTRGRSRGARLRRCARAPADPRVVVIGPAHFVPFRGIAVPTAKLPHAARRRAAGSGGDRGDPRSAAGALRRRAASSRARARGRAAVPPDRCRRLLARALWSATRSRARLPRCSSGCGAAGRPYRGQLRSFALRGIRERASSTTRATAVAIEASDPRLGRAGLRPSADRGPADRGQAARYPGVAARSAQLGRHRRSEGPGRRLWRLGFPRAIGDPP